MAGVDAVSAKATATPGIATMLGGLGVAQCAAPAGRGVFALRRRLSPAALTMRAADSSSPARLDEPGMLLWRLDWLERAYY